MNRIERQKDSKRRVLDAVASSPIPIDIESIRIKSGLKAWIQTKALCMELMAEGKIVGEPTTKSWIFWVRSSSNQLKEVE